MCKIEFFCVFFRESKTKKQSKTQSKTQANSELEAMSFNANTLLRQVGIYTDLINLVNDYTVGEKSYWKGKYESVMHELIKEFEEGQIDTIQEKLGRKIGYATRKKLACIMQQYDGVINESEKTVSVYDHLKRYGIVGIHRVAFDKLVFKVKQMLKVKNYNSYHYKSNYPPSFMFHINGKLMRHLYDYNHTEYECYIHGDKSKIWISKMCWGNRVIQQCKQKIGKNLCSIREKKTKWLLKRKQETENNFCVKFQLANNVKISYVNEKSVRVSVNKFDGKPVEVTKKICEEKKTNRLYICHPVLKKRRLYADKKYMHYPEEMFALYKNM